MFSFSSCRVRRLTLISSVILAAIREGLFFIVISTAGTDAWYLTLNKSQLNPPSYIFGLVWPILYILMIVSAFLTYRKVFSVFLIQLIFNAAWSWLFFRFQMPLVALFDIYILIIINIYLLYLMYKESKIGFLLFIPYVLWISFASYLNLFIVINN